MPISLKLVGFRWIHCHAYKRKALDRVLITVFALLSMLVIWTIHNILLGSLEAEQEEATKLKEQAKAIARLYPKGKALPY